MKGEIQSNHHLKYEVTFNIVLNLKDMPMPFQSAGQICFVITPSDAEGTDGRRQADRLVDQIIRPAVEPFGYVVARSDGLGSPDTLHKDLLLNLADAPLAIANLTGKNPSVFYSLAFRHSLEKPIILLCARGETLPFDPDICRVIWFDLDDETALEPCQNALTQQIQANRENQRILNNPITTLVDVQQVRDNAPFTAEEVRAAFDKLPDFNERPYDLRILVQRLKQNSIHTRGQLAELLSRGILDTIRTLYLEELYRRKDNLLDHEGVAVWGSYFVHRGISPENIQRVRKAMAGFPEYQRNHGDLEILEARYGANNVWRDVTDILRSEIRSSRLRLRVANDSFRRKGEPSRWDPMPGVTKHLEVYYTYKNQHFFKEYVENELLNLPAR
jgi:hypothetical protein